MINSNVNSKEFDSQRYCVLSSSFQFAKLFNITPDSISTKSHAINTRFCMIDESPMFFYSDEESQIAVRF